MGEKLEFEKRIIIIHHIDTKLMKRPNSEELRNGKKLKTDVDGQLTALLEKMEWVDDYEEVLEIAEKILKIDESHEEALMEGFWAALELDEFEMCVKFGQKYLQIYKNFGYIRKSYADALRS